MPGMKKRINVSIEQAHYEYLKRHPEINLSGLIQKTLNDMMSNPGNRETKQPQRDNLPLRALTNKIEASKRTVECDKCGYTWEYSGKRKRIQCLECGHRITLT